MIISACGDVDSLHALDIPGEKNHGLYYFMYVNENFKLSKYR